MKNLRKPQAKYALHKFFKEENDINFFIEDKDRSTKKVFKEMLSNVFCENKVSKVYPLGGRHEVVKQCRLAKNKQNKGKEIYVIDGDLYLLTGENVEVYGDFSDLENLFVLQKYSIENFLLNETAIIEILNEEDCEKDIDELKALLDYNSWIEKNESLFKELYIHYAIACYEKTGIKTINSSINKLVSSDLGELDNDKVKMKVAEIKNQIVACVGESKYEATKDVIESRINKEEVFVSKYVSGKDHLFPLILTRMKRITKLRCEHDTYKVRLAMKSVTSEFYEIRNLADKLYA